MARDSGLQQRIDKLEAEARELALFGSSHKLSRVRRRIAMLLEDERQPTFRAAAEFGRDDDYTAWRKAQGL